MVSVTIRSAAVEPGGHGWHRVASPDPRSVTAPLTDARRLAALLAGPTRPVVLDVRWRLGGPPGRAGPRGRARARSGVRRPGHRAGRAAGRRRAAPAARPGCAAGRAAPGRGVRAGPGWSRTTTAPARSRRGRGGCCAGPGRRRPGRGARRRVRGVGRGRACRSPRRRATGTGRRRRASRAGCRSSTPTAPRSWPARGVLLDARAGAALPRGDRAGRPAGRAHPGGAQRCRRPSTSARTAVGFRRPARGGRYAAGRRRSRGRPNGDRRGPADATAASARAADRVTHRSSSPWSTRAPSLQRPPRCTPGRGRSGRRPRRPVATGASRDGPGTGAASGPRARPACDAWTAMSPRRAGGLGRGLLGYDLGARPPAQPRPAGADIAAGRRARRAGRARRCSSRSRPDDELHRVHVPAYLEAVRAAPVTATTRPRARHRRQPDLRGHARGEPR